MSRLDQAIKELKEVANSVNEKIKLIDYNLPGTNLKYGRRHSDSPNIKF